MKRHDPTAFAEPPLLRLQHVVGTSRPQRTAPAPWNFHDLSALHADPDGVSAVALQLAADFRRADAHMFNGGTRRACCTCKDALLTSGKQKNFS